MRIRDPGWKNRNTEYRYVLCRHETLITGHILSIYTTVLFLRNSDSCQFVGVCFADTTLRFWQDLLQKLLESAFFSKIHQVLSFIEMILNLASQCSFSFWNNHVYFLSSEFTLKVWICSSATGPRSLDFHPGNFLHNLELRVEVFYRVQLQVILTIVLLASLGL